MIDKIENNTHKDTDVFTIKWWIKYNLVKNMEPIDKTDYDSLCNKSSLTKTEFANVLNYALTHEGEHIITLKIKKFTEEQETILSKLIKHVFLTNKINWFNLDCLEEISFKAAEMLWRFKFLSLCWLKTITPNIAWKFSDVRFLYLDWLKEINSKIGKRLWEKDVLSIKNVEIEPDLIRDTFSSIKYLRLKWDEYFSVKTLKTKKFPF